jgi:hypothetical protein
VSHIVRKNNLLMRLVSGVVVVAVTAASALLVSNAVAGADPTPGTLGFIILEQPQGTNLTAINSNTTGPCPATSNRADLQVVGPMGVPAAQQIFPASNPFTAVTPIATQFSTTTPFRQQWRVSFQDAVHERGVEVVPTGEYDFTASCLPRFGSTNFGTFTGGLLFDTPMTYHSLPNASGTPTPTPVGTPTDTPMPTPVGTPTDTPMPTDTPTPTPTPISGTAATTTTLTVFPRSAFQGIPVIFLANVAPVGATGTVQFADGTTPLGAPVPVTSGFALFIDTLPTGPHSLTAAFSPTDPAAFTSSTSAPVALTVQPIPGVPANGGPPVRPRFPGFSWIFGFLRFFNFGR